MRDAEVTQGPDFVCIGAQKAGTTWLYHNLAAQRGIWMPPEKEIHFFDTVCPHEALLGVAIPKGSRGLRRYEPLLRNPSLATLAWLRRFHGSARSTRWYYSLFSPRITGGRLAGDITPAYSTLDERGVLFARRVLKPGCKVMLIVRNPVDRAWSALKMKYRARGAAPPLEDVDALLRLANRPAHRLRGDYARMIPLWRDAFGDDFEVFRYDHLAGAPADFLRRVGTFLGAGIDVFPDADRRYNSDREGIRAPELLHARLGETFEPEIQQLDELLPGIAAEWSSTNVNLQ